MNRFFDFRLRERNGVAENELLFWRERIVHATLISASVLGAGVYAFNLNLAIQNHDGFWAMMYTLLYGAVVLITLRRKWAYTFRAVSLLLLLYGLGLISAWQYGAGGDARIWLMGFSVLTAVFLGLRAGVGAALFSTLTLLVLGALMSKGLIAAPDVSDILQPTNFTSWSSTAIPFLLIALITASALGLIVNSLNRSLKQARQLTLHLERDRAALKQRAQILERRQVQVRTAAEISRALSAELDPDTLFRQVVELVKDRFALYYVGVFLVDEDNQFAILRAGTGEAGRQMIARGYKLPIGGTSMIGWAISRRQARISLDVGTEAVRFDNPYLPKTRSELALPMTSGDQVLGALTVQSTQPEAFDEDDIVVLQGVADSLAIAIENSRLFQQTQDALHEIRKLHQQYLGEAWTEILTAEGKLHYTVERETPSPDASRKGQCSSIKVPLVLRDQVLGTLTLEADKPAWSPEEKAFVEAIATQAAQALENIRLVEETQKAALHDRIVKEISSKAWSTTDIDTILQTTLQELGRTLQASHGIIQLDIQDTIEQ